MAYYVYMLRCGDGTHYTGISLDPLARLRAHRSGRGARYTRGRGPLELVYAEEVGPRADAQRRERQLKAMSSGAKRRLARPPAEVQAELQARLAASDATSPPATASPATPPARGASTWQAPGGSEAHREVEPGALYLVATPIGHLADITLRALRVLSEVDWVAAEDTRHSGQLLTHYGIKGRFISYREHNRRTAGERIIRLLKSGHSIALVTDAGTPGVSDPGQELVSRAWAEGIPVHPVPGPTAAVAALTASGLPTERFAFEGFPPARGRERAAFFARLVEEDRTVIIYEAPHRLARTLAELSAAVGDRPVVLARELTKRFETFDRGRAAELAGRVGEVRGEVCLVVAGRLSRGRGGGDGRMDGEPGRATLDGSSSLAWALQEVERLIGAGARPGEAVREVADRLHLDRRQLYAARASAREEKE